MLCHSLRLSLACVLASTVLITGCGGGDDPNDPDPTPTPTLDRASIGYRLLRGVDRLDEPKTGVARLYSSHNPSDAANRDYNWYRRRDADGSYVLVDHTGPGVIMRIWMTGWQGPTFSSGGPGFAASAQLRVYVDGSATPLFAINPNRFFAGELFPFVPPLVGQHSSAKGYFSYVPISFTTSVKVTLTGPYPPPSASPAPTDLFFYQIHVLDLSGQGPVQPSPSRQADSTLALSAEDQAAHQEALGQWRDPLAFANRMTQARETASFAGPVSGTALLADLAGPGRIRGLRLRTANVSAADLERVQLRIRWDGEPSPSVDIPLGTAWSQHYLRSQFQSLTQGALTDGTLYLNVPMPFRQSARLELVNSAAGALPIAGDVYYDRGAPAGGARYFHAVSNVSRVRGATRLLMAQANGSGHLVGLHLVVDVDSDSHALEGDEFIVVDGTSQYEGTGTEDFFNAHWFFAGGLRSQPLHGTTSTGSRTRPDVDAYRWMVPDLVPFGSSLRFELENGNDATNTDSYRSVAFYYLAQ